MPRLPLIAITLGDPAGTGPELILQALAQPAVMALARWLIVGDAGTLEQAQTYTGTRLTLRAITGIGAAHFASDGLDVLDLHNVDLTRLQLGRVDPQLDRRKVRRPR